MSATESPAPTRRPAGLRGSQAALLLVRASHPRQALLTAVGLAVAAAMSGRAPREVGLVLATVLMGQLLLGWHNDLVDRERDARHGTPGKPVADGTIDPSNAWFAVTVAALLVVPLALSNSITAGLFYLASLLFGVMADRQLRGGPLSWVPWAIAFGLYPFFLSYGGWGGGPAGGPPTWPMVALAALLGVAVHVLTSLPGLVADHEDGVRHLPLRVALRTGAPRLLVVTGVVTGLVIAALGVVGATLGLRA